jgi:hypothetical protein
MFTSSMKQEMPKTCKRVGILFKLTKMKKLRFLLIALVFAGGITAAFAFSHKSAPQKRDSSWFLYDPHFSGGTANPDNYVIMSGLPTCTTGNVRCAIEAPVVNGEQPDLDNITDERLKP